MDTQTIGGFSCDATTPSGNSPYYQLTSPPTAPIYQPLECESLSAQGPFPYYALNTSPDITPVQLQPHPDTGVVPNPSGGSEAGGPLFFPVGQTTSQAFSVGPYGGAAPVSSGQVGYGISALQYAKNSSYFVPASSTIPPGQPPSEAPYGLALAAPAITDTIPVIFSTAGIVGSPTLIYEIFWQPAQFPSEFWSSALAQPILTPNGPTTDYTASATNLSSATIYKMYASVRNGFGAQLSPVTTFSTPGGGVPPGGSLSTPAQVPSGNNSTVQVQFFTTGLTGNPYPALYVDWGTTTTPTTRVLANIVPGTPATYRASVSGLTPATDYYFKAVADNGNAPAITTAVAGPFRTGGSNSPSSAPPAPVVSGTPTISSISVTVNVAGITGTPTPSFILSYGTTIACSESFGQMTRNGNVASATVTGLAANTAYYFRATATNGVPTDKPGIISAPIYTAGTPGGTPPRGNAGQFTPYKNATVSPNPSDTTISLICNPASIVGSPNPQFKLLYGLTSDPVTDPNALSVPINAFPILPAITGLIPATKYYFRAVAFNGVSPDFLSGIANYTTTGSGGNTPPSGPPTVPVVSTPAPTSTTITASFSAANITGSPTLAYTLGFSDVSGGPYQFAPALRDGTTDTYYATITNLTPSTPYYFVSKVSNSFPPDQTSAQSAPISTTAGPAPTRLKTNLVTPFLLQGPRFGATPGAWTAIDYYINNAAVGATYQVGGTTATGQQIFASMYAGTIGDAGNATGSTPPCQYAGACIADQPFAALGGTGAANYSDVYLKLVQQHIKGSGRVLACWGGFYADILGLFGPYVPKGFPGTTQPTAVEVVKSFLYNYCGITAGNTNPLGWVRTNASGNSGYTFNYDGLILDFENVGNGNPLNSWPYPPPPTPPDSKELIQNPIYPPYIQALADIPAAYYAIAPTLFLGNAPVSLSLVQDEGQTNICASNTALGTWFAFQTATVAPTAGAYNPSPSAALNHPSQLCYFDDIFVQFYNEYADYYLGGKYFANLLACWGYVALEAQKLGKKKTTINLGLANGEILPGGSPPWKAAAQGPTPQLNNQSGPPYTYWFPQYCKASPPNNTSNTAYDTWPDTGVAKDPTSVAVAIATANTILRTAQNNQNLQPSDWLSGMGFWAGGGATTTAKAVYTSGNPLSPGSILPAGQTYCWSDAQYPAPDPQWFVGSTFNVPINSTL